jgi:hypothetical protein
MIKDAVTFGIDDSTIRMARGRDRRKAKGKSEKNKRMH